MLAVRAAGAAREEFIRELRVLPRNPSDMLWYPAVMLPGTPQDRYGRPSYRGYSDSESMARREFLHGVPSKSIATAAPLPLTTSPKFSPEKSTGVPSDEA